MRQLSHPNIVSLIEFQESRDYYFLVLELCSGGELFHQIVRLTYFSEDLSRHVILQVAKGIRYLHEEKGVVHRYYLSQLSYLTIGISNLRIYYSNRFHLFLVEIPSHKRQKMKKKKMKANISQELVPVESGRSRLQISVYQKSCGIHRQ